jgi:hypothetical protein
MTITWRNRIPVIIGVFMGGWFLILVMGTVLRIMVGWTRWVLDGLTIGG